MSTAAPNNQGGYTLTPIALFVLSTAMASATATAVAFMLTSSAQAAPPTECTCSCEAPQAASVVPTAPVVEAAPTPDPVEPEREVVPPKRSEAPKASVSPPIQAKGSLDKAIIRRIVRAHLSEVRHCYNNGLAEDPILEGRVNVQFTIAPSGKVPVAVVASSTLDHDATENCIAKSVKRWKFPKPEGGGNVVVTYPFVLQPTP
jgi:TonB family protein